MFHETKKNEMVTPVAVSIFLSQQGKAPGHVGSEFVRIAVDGTIQITPHPKHGKHSCCGYVPVQE